MPRGPLLFGNCGGARHIMQMTNITIVPAYGSRVAVVPVPDGSAWREATREQLAVLLAVMAQPELSYLAVGEKTGATREQIDGALAYWEAAGVLTLRRAEAAPPVAAVRPASPRPDARPELPRYSSEELARVLEANPTAAGLIDCCQQEMGKVFNTAEAEVIVGLYDYLSMNAEYILLLCAHCAKRGHRSLRYIEKMAVGLYDEGIVTYDALDVHLRRLERTDDAEGALREMFGIGKRALIKREKECFSRWIGEWEMPIEVVRHAYEITVGRTHEPSVAYANAILERWHAEGLTTLEAVEAAEAKAAPGTPKSGSFDTDDFFEEALRRSYGDK